jgi:hypothetical protein
VAKKKCRGSRLLSLGHIPGGLDITGVNLLHVPRSVKQHLVSSQNVRESKWMTPKFVLTDYHEILKLEEPTLLKRSYLLAPTTESDFLRGRSSEQTDLYQNFL